MPDKKPNSNLQEILDRIKSLEERISLLESDIGHSKQLQPSGRPAPVEEDTGFVNIDLSLSAPFENKLGEYGLAWMGSIVFFFAVTFLWQYFNDNGKPVIALLAGVIGSAGVFILSRYFRKDHTYLSFIFRLFGYIILYYALLRLHYFNSQPLVKSQWIATAIILISIGIQVFFAVKNRSQVIAGMAFAMALFTAFVCYQKFAFFSISIVTVSLALYFFARNNWWKALTFTMIISFVINLIWLLKNPVSLAKTPGDLTYHFAFAGFSVMTILYSLLAFRKPSDGFPQNLILTLILLSGFFYAILLSVLMALQFPTTYEYFFLPVSLYCIAYSILLQFYSPWKFSPALFALFGFVSISMLIFGTYGIPKAYFLLTVESFLVLIVALWYRSHIITLINTFLLILIAAVYYNTSGTLIMVNFAIPAVAFLSARIINWQKERLNIKTDLIRNIYLFILFFSMLYATFKALPGQYVTVSWLVIAGIYFTVSIILDNYKYRRMAIANLLVSAIHLFLVDLAKIDMIYRILAFLFFAFVSIVISVYYVKKLKKKGLVNNVDNAG